MKTRVPETKTRRVTANVPTKLLEEACLVSGLGITETLLQGLERVRRSGAAAKAKKLEGKLKLEVDREVSRERARR
jgi:hypothetical protein